MVPVLSKQRVSTRASISMQYNSCTIALFFAKRKKDAASAILVSKNGPAGIIVMIEPAVNFNASLFKLNRENFPPPSAYTPPQLMTYKLIVAGMMTIATTSKMVFNDFSIWLRGFWYCLALSVKPDT